MSISHFISSRRSAWDRMDELLTKAKGLDLRLLTEDELLEFTRLYPSIVVDLSRARAQGVDRALVQRINLLAVRAHGLLYRRTRSLFLPAISSFFLRSYPRLFRSLWRYFALSTTVFCLGMTSSYVVVRADPNTAYVLFPGTIDGIDGSSGLSSDDMSERFQQLPKTALAAFVTTNNIGVAFSAFSLGITFGLGTAYTLLFNGIMVGAMAGHFANHGFFPVFAQYLVGHGCLEIFAILTAGAAGLRLGLSLAIPGNLTRGASFRQGARLAVQLVLGTIPMFIVAGLIEGFVTPSHASASVRWTVGLSALFLFVAYLCFAGRSQKASIAPDVP